MANEARAAILARIQSAVATHAGGLQGEIAQQWAALPRSYSREASRSRAEILELFEERLRDYEAHAERVSRADLSGAIARRLREQGSPRMIVPAGMPADALAGGEFTMDAGFDYAALDGFGGVMTLATLGIALTGTLVLQNVAGQGRRAATLIPDYHLCLIGTDAVVEGVPEAMALLAPTASLATTFVSGPSATADIEMTRIKGVHGPRVLDVLLVEGRL